MKKTFSIRIVGRSKRIRIPKHVDIEEGTVVLVEVIDENTIVVKKVSDCKEEWIKNRGMDLSFDYLSFEYL